MATTNWAEAQQAAQANVVARPVNPTKTTSSTPAQFTKLCKAIESAYPDLKPDPDAVAKAGQPGLLQAVKNKKPDPFGPGYRGITG